MATLTIRNVPEELHDALRRRAAENRRSMEAEVREVLSANLIAAPRQKDVSEILAAFWAMTPRKRPGEPEGWSGVDEFLAEKRLEAAWENEVITTAERRSWLERLERFETNLAEIEAFIASRRVS